MWVWEPAPGCWSGTYLVLRGELGLARDAKMTPLKWKPRLSLATEKTVNKPPYFPPWTERFLLLGSTLAVLLPEVPLAYTLGAKQLLAHN